MRLGVFRICEIALDIISDEVYSLFVSWNTRDGQISDANNK